VPFEASVNRAPGSLFQTDADGFVRNTYLLKITNNEPSLEPVAYEVRVDGIEGAQVLTSEISVPSEGSTTVPLVVRAPLADELARTVPLRVRITSADGELLLPTTFKTGATMGGDQ
jgi:hypothetical protein